MLLLTSLKDLLENVVAELVFCQFHTFLNQSFEDCLFSVWLSILDDELNGSRTVLISSPVACLFEVIQDLFFRGEGGEVVRGGNVDCAVASVLFLGLQAQSE